jgi:hypothetical protein
MVLLGNRTTFVTRSMRRRHGVGYIGRHQAGGPAEPEVPTPARVAGGRTRRRQGQRVNGAAMDAAVGLPGWIGPSADQSGALPEVHGAEPHDRVR